MSLDAEAATTGYMLTADKVEQFALDGIDRDEAAAWVTKGFMPGEAHVWKAEGFDPETANEWGDRFSLAHGDCGPPFRAGMTIPEARSWKDAGFTSEASAEWHTKGIGRHVATEWRDSGYTPGDAAYWCDRGQLTAASTQFYFMQNETRRLIETETGPSPSGDYTLNNEGEQQTLTHTATVDGVERATDPAPGVPAVVSFDPSGESKKMSRHFLRSGEAHDAGLTPAVTTWTVDGEVNYSRRYSHGELANGPYGEPCSRTRRADGTYERMWVTAEGKLSFDSDEAAPRPLG